jgi:ribonuclease G
MVSRLLANCSPVGHRVALTDDKRLVEIHIEQPSSEFRVGNIFKGRVTNIVPGMECAFVDIGGTRDLFLPMSDVNHGQSRTSDPGEEKSAVDPIPQKPDLTISDVLNVGQEIMVQVVKEPISTKGPRGTTYLSLPGRYLVLMPTNTHVGISRRIEDPVDIARLQEIGMGIKPREMGLIIRTVAAKQSREDLLSDLDFLINLWDSIQKRAMQSPTPSLIHEDSALLLKVVRDLFNSSIDEFLIDSKEEFDQVMSYCRFFPDHLKRRIQHYSGNIFKRHSIEEEIHKATNEKVSLPSGGSLVIQETEALISIDVNTGSYTGTRDLEDTVFNTNLEAAKEVARQMRLRNLGGILVIDFIDMLSMEHREQVQQTLEEACAKDKTRFRIMPIDELGTLSMTRQRVGKALGAVLFDRCPYCRGRGKVASKNSITNKIYRELKNLCSSKHHSEVVLTTCHPEVASYLLERNEQKFKQLEEKTNTKIFIRGDSGLHYEQFKFSQGASD